MATARMATARMARMRMVTARTVTVRMVRMVRLTKMAKKRTKNNGRGQGREFTVREPRAVHCTDAEVRRRGRLRRK